MQSSPWDPNYMQSSPWDPKKPTLIKKKECWSEYRVVIDSEKIKRLFSLCYDKILRLSK